MNILLITEYIAPVNAIASIRWTKLSKYLTEHHGAKIDVLTNYKNYKGKKLFSENYVEDPTLKNDVSFFRNVYIIQEGVKLKALHGIHNAARFIEGTMPSRKTDCAQSIFQGSSDTSGSKKLSARSQIRDCLIQAEGNSLFERALLANINYSEYDIVVSSYGPKWTHQIAADIKKKNPNIAWIADYRDPFVGSNATDTEENRSFAKRLTGDADCVVAVSEGGANLLFLDSAQRIEIVTNGYDPDDIAFRKRISSDKFELTYTGTLYNEGEARRDITPLFRALSDLIRSGSISEEDVVVRYAGLTEDNFIKQSLAFPDVPVESAGHISRDRALEMQSRASLLIHCTWNTHLIKGVLTGKLFEYLAGGVPIVALSAGNAPDSQVKDIIEKANAGFCYEEASGETDYIELKRFVGAAYEQWKQRGITLCNADMSYVSQFSHVSLAAQMSKIMDSLTLAKENNR